MSSSSRGADAPPNANLEPTTWPEPETEEQDDVYAASNEEYDHVYGPSVKATESNTSDQVLGQVDQFSDPEEAPEEFDMEYVRSQGITGFLVKVANRLRTLKDPLERSQVRHQFMDLIRDLKVDKTSQPPYNEAASYQIRQLLEERGLGETLLLDFELLLHVFEEQAQQHSEEAEKRKQEIEEEERKKQEWDVVKEDEAEDEWEMV